MSLEVNSIIYPWIAECSHRLKNWTTMNLESIFHILHTHIYHILTDPSYSTCVWFLWFMARVNTCQWVGWNTIQYPPRVCSIWNITNGNQAISLWFFTKNSLNITTITSFFSIISISILSDFNGNFNIPTRIPKFIYSFLEISQCCF